MGQLATTRLYSINTPYANQGYTLIELTIAILLGLLITAAATMLFLNSSNNYNIQKAAEDVQDAEVFAVDNMRKEIAMANLGSYRPIKQETPWTGIIFTTNVTLTSSAGGEGKNLGGNLRGFQIVDDYISKSNYLSTKDPLEGISNVNQFNSDQLTISYRAPFNMINCVGSQVAAGSMVIERYYTAVDTATKGTNDPNELSIALWCDAGTFTLPPTANPENVSSGAYGKITLTGGQPIVNRVDTFKVKVGVQKPTGIIYMPISDYIASSGGKYTHDDPVVAVQIGLITHAANPISMTTPTTFKLFGSDVTIKDTSKNYIRRVYESTVRIRNSGVAS